MKQKAIQKWSGTFFCAMFIASILSACSSTHKAVKPTADDIKDMVNSSQFVFVAERVSPMRSGTRNLTSRYTVEAKKDTLISYLPYFGQATQAPANMTGGGIEFTSLKFSYDAVLKKEGQWDVTIKPENNRDVQQMFFSIFSNGSASLRVTSTYRDPISFSGYLEKLKSK